MKKTSAFHPYSVMSGLEARSRKWHGSFWRNQTSNLTAVNDRPWVDYCRSMCSSAGSTVIRFNNRLGDLATINAFDEAMRTIPDGNALALDLRDTPSGGNTMVARAIMGWFVSEPRGYQIHNRPAEEHETGIQRQWVEQVLPRKGTYRAQLPTVVVGRWTGSMGEGIAIGFAALGAEVVGTRMAGLKGAVEDLRAGDADLSVKLPTSGCSHPPDCRGKNSSFNLWPMIDRSWEPVEELIAAVLAPCARSLDCSALRHRVLPRRAIVAVALEA